MSGLTFINFDDYYNRWSLKKVVEITSKVSDYCAKNKIVDPELLYVEDSSWADKANERIDIEIRYTNKDGILMQQKLLMLKGEIIDGKEFHKRYNEFYPKKTAV